MFLEGQDVIFKGYFRPPTKGNPLLTIGKIYKVYEVGQTGRWIKVRNDKGNPSYYRLDQFEAVQPKGE